ncbi:MAG TPA: right-handed parallel beta-helix repeat-containing protein [Chitinivibrionales bacterium]|nr:right-handed parallel beta-helix repeat-containing protein [Chitinivibrionales bacterium]
MLIRPIFPVLFVLSFFSLTLANTHFVDGSSTGSDTYAGTSAAPWKTLQHAADNVGPGDTVIVKPGTYAGFVMGWDNPENGTASAPIVFLAQTGAIINSRNNKTADGIDLEGASYIVLDGFIVKNAGTITRAGIRAVTDTGAVIRDNSIDSCGTWGILTGFAENVLIENNVCSRAVVQHGIYFSNSADHPVIRGNRVFSNNANGIHMNGDVSQGGDGVISNALVENNIIYDNGRAGGSGINCDGVKNSRFQNNLLYNNHASGISLYQTDASEGSTFDTVVNNTIIEAADARWCVNIQNTPTGIILYNNILYNYHSWHGSIDVGGGSTVGLTSDYNIVMDRLTPDDNTVLTLAQWRSQTGQDMHSIVAAPAQLFVNPDSGNYHLLDTCVAVDKGTSQFAPSRDIEGTARPQGKGFDIGAYEAGNGAGVLYSGNGVRLNEKPVVRFDTKRHLVTFAGMDGENISAVAIYSVAGKCLVNNSTAGVRMMTWRPCAPGTYVAVVNIGRASAKATFVVDK